MQAHTTKTIQLIVCIHGHLIHPLTLSDVLFESHVTAPELKLDIARSWTMAVKGKKFCLQSHFHQAKC